MKISIARKITLTATVVLVIVGLIWHTGSGTLSSFGWDAIAAICPLGIVETFLASKLLIPRALLVLVAIAVITILLGKVFCAWLCPIPSLRKLFLRKASKKEPAPELEKDDVSQSPSVQETLSLKTGSCVSGSAGCSSCTVKRKKLDSRHLVLGGALVSTAIFGFPVFCLVCPVGLTFATIIAFWRMVGFNEPTFSILVFPAILIIEILFLKKWCLKFCPLGAVMSLMSIPNKLFKPKVDKSKCLRGQGIDCTVCVDICAEELDPHFTQGMHECTKCGLCKEQCPAQAISIAFLPSKGNPDALKPVTDSKNRS